MIRRAKDRIREKLGVTMAEVGGQDTWQRSDLAFAVVSGERDRVQAACKGVLQQVAGIEGGQVAAARIEVLAFGDDWYAAADQTGRAWEEKVGGESDLSWVPREWLEGGDGE